jgi:hypothetical protein
MLFAKDSELNDETRFVKDHINFDKEDALDFDKTFYYAHVDSKSSIHIAQDNTDYLALIHNSAILFDRKLICFSPRIKKCPFYDER